MLHITTCVVTPFQQNCRLLVDEETESAVLIDPGGDAERLAAVVLDSGAELRSLVLTHSHIDHCAGVAALNRIHGEVPLVGSSIEKSLREGIGNQALLFGLSPAEYENCPEPDIDLTDGDVVTIGNTAATALFTPGHSPGHFAFYFESGEWIVDGRRGDGPLLIAGDTLFSGSIGRTDLPGGNHAQLIDSITSRLLTLPDQTLVLCGHGPSTTIVDERNSNPFLR